MTKIARHQTDMNFMIKQTIDTKQLVDKIYQRIISDHNVLSLSTLFFILPSYPGYLSVTQPESDEICKAIQLIAKLAAGAFALASTSEKELEVYLDNNIKVRLPAKIDESEVNCSAWMSGFFAAAICRDLTVLDSLGRIPLELLRRSSTRYDEFMFSFIAALQGYWRGERDAARHLMAAMADAKPEKIQCCSEEYLYLKAVPQMEMMFQLMRKDGEAFNRSLYTALESHRELCNLDEDTRLDSDFYLAYDLLALSSLAYEQGMAVHVESDYLPLSIVQGKCAV
ncbi:immunity 49 family protein [Gloeobacter violaceus]|uniref:Glr0231 protein n=1 Tax=Gloeobacter violaceus (strain ATCC 29082 / PCC 7421) TaxID=251221 RepID=Q7NP27_GLOVI|nr:immunity 49 family protein [Gloeobacter violaceus]BAC88172.1 glr0231 [Gloeobacter violaceus PCC 7421]